MHPTLKSQSQGFIGIGLSIFLIFTFVAAALWGKNNASDQMLGEHQLFIAIFLLIVGIILFALLFLKGRALLQNPPMDCQDYEEYLPESLGLRSARIVSCLAAANFIAILLLWVFSAVVGTLFVSEMSEAFNWWPAIIIAIAYLLGWFWALYMSFPRFTTSTGYIGMIVGLIVYSIISTPIMVLILFAAFFTG